MCAGTEAMIGCVRSMLERGNRGKSVWGWEGGGGDREGDQILMLFEINTNFI